MPSDQRTIGPQAVQTNRQADVQLAEALANVLGCKAEDRAWLRQLLGHFPVPTIDHVHHLIFAVGRLRRAARWWPELVGDAGFFESLARVEKAVRGAIASGQVGQASARGRGGSVFSGSFLRTGTLLTDQLMPSRGLECLRVLLVGLCWRWARSGTPRQSSIEDIARTIRAVAAAKLGDEPVLPGRFLMELGDLLDQETLSIPPRVDESAASLGFADAWNRQVIREIEQILSYGSPPVTPEPPLPAPAPSPPSGGPSPSPPRPPSKGPKKNSRGPWSERREPSVDRQLAGYRRRVHEPEPGEASLEPGESTEEVVPPQDVLPADSVPRNPDGREVATYQVAQAIWGRNGLLAPNHVDVLPHDILRQACGALVNALGPDGPCEDERPGLVGLFLQAFTGRTARSLTALNILPDENHPHDPRSFDLLIKEGMLRFTAFWQVGRDGDPEPSFFRPDEDAALHLEPTTSVYLLPLSPSVIDVLRNNSGALRSLVSNPRDIEQHLNKAAGWLSETLEWPITPGMVRNSFGVYLFEQCRDLGLTQLLAADTFGNSTAPLSYYAPKAQTLAATYWDYQASLLPEAAPVPRLPDPEERVGSRLLASSSSVTDMVRAISAPLRHGVTKLVEKGEPHRVHLAMVCQMTGMLVGALTHRPAEALLRLTRWDFLLEGRRGAALFSDKRVDAAHDPRLVVLPLTACRQFEAYLNHLVGLAELRPTLAPYIYGVLRGEHPLFFAWDGADTIKPLTYGAWRAAMPASWHHLPFNWGRHWCRTHAAELGVRPEFLNMQMGHLEAVGYPFSGASPTEPASWVEELAPVWDAVVRAQGWTVLSGLTHGDTATVPAIPPLRPWEQLVQEHRAKTREKERFWRQALRAKMRRYREEAIKEVLACDELVAAGITSRYQSAEPQEPHTFTREDFERIRDSFMDDADGTSLAMGLAKADALCRIARVVNRRTSQSAQDPAPLYLPRRPLDNAFTPGMMLAVSQVHAVRGHIAEWSGQNKPGPKDDLPLACARTALALMLFGYCDDPKKILGILERRHLAIRSAAIKDLLVVPWGEEAGQVYELRGAAAIALAKLARKFPEGDVPVWGTLAGRMIQFLPGWALGDKGSARDDPCKAVEALLQSVGMTNRYELSPAARIGIGNGGCVAAHPEEQIALVDGDPAGTLSRNWLEGVEGEESTGATALAPSSKGSARTQYRALCAVFPERSRDTRLPLTGHTIPSGQAADGRHRQPVMAEIQAMLDTTEEGDRLQPVVRLLAAWCLDMLAHGTQRKKSPALRTIETYLSRVGGALVHVMGHRRLDSLDEVELEEAYLAAVNCKEGDQAAAAATLLSLHKFGRRQFGLADADLAPLYNLAGQEAVANADARLILPAERDRMLRQLEVGVQDHTSERNGNKMDEARVLRQARAAAEVLVGSGARHSEVLGLQIRNVRPVDGGTMVMLRPNPSRRLKTPSARRNVLLEARPESATGLGLTNWLEVEAVRLPERSRPRAFLFAPRSDPRAAVGREKIAEAILKAAKEATGLPSARVHQLRHLFAIESLTPIFLTDQDRVAVQGSLSLRPTPTWRGGVALPRDLRAQTLTLGHSDPLTTLIWYHHLPFLLRSRPDAALTRRHLNVNTLATLLGVTRDAVRWPIKQAHGRDPLLVWMDHEMEPRVRPLIPEASLAPSEITASEPRRWTAARLAELLAMATRTGMLEHALTAIGAAPAEADLLRASILPIELRFGRCLIRDKELALISARPKRHLRPMQEAGGINALWRIYDQDVEGRRTVLAQIARQVVDHAAPTDADRIRLPSAQMAKLVQQLRDVGIEDACMRRSSLGAGLSELRILRPRKSSGPSESKETHTETLDWGGVREIPASHGADSGPYLGLQVKRVLAVICLAENWPSG